MFRLRDLLALTVCLLPIVECPVKGEPPGKEGPARPDLYGDPLPPGAVARLGTVRLRHGHVVNSVVFSPDGTTLISGGGREIHFWDVATGRELRELPAEGQILALSSDGK